MRRSRTQPSMYAVNMEASLVRPLDGLGLTAHGTVLHATQTEPGEQQCSWQMSDGSRRWGWAR